MSLAFAGNCGINLKIIQTLILGSIRSYLEILESTWKYTKYSEIYDSTQNYLGENRAQCFLQRKISDRFLQLSQAS